MLSNNESAFQKVQLHKSIYDPSIILKTYHKNCMYKEKSEQSEKSFNEASTQCQNSQHFSFDEPIELHQTCYFCSSTLMKDHQQSNITKHNFHPSRNKYILINPFSMIDRVNQSQQYLKFLNKQNTQLNEIYKTFIKNLQKYVNNFLVSLQYEHCLYGIYRHDMIRYIIVLQEYLNELRTKFNIFEQGKKNLNLFRKHFHDTLKMKRDFENLLDKHEKYLKQIFDKNQSIKYEEKFFEIYQTSYTQFRIYEQQRLLAIREQMRFTINLTLNRNDNHNLFNSNNFDDLLNDWDSQYTVALNHWSYFQRRSTISRHDMTISLFKEIKQIIDEYYKHRYKFSNDKQIDSVTSDVSQSHI